MDLKRDVAVAYAPAAVGNVAVGFDLLGHAIDAPGDIVTVRHASDDQVLIKEITGIAGGLPTMATENSAGAALIALREHLGLAAGFSVKINKGIPLGSGMGGSGASAVAAVFAANALLDKPLATEDLLPFALAGEAAATGAAPIDNVAPQLLGGLRLAHPDGGTPIALPVPPGLQCVLVYPDCSIETRQSRAGLNENIALAMVTEQAGLLAAFVSACHSGDIDLLSRSLRDVLIEPQRSSGIPGFADVRQAAMKNSALGCSLPGSGPAVFAWCRQSDAKTIAAAMRSAFERSGLASSACISAIDAPGVRLLDNDNNL